MMRKEIEGAGKHVSKKCAQQKPHDSSLRHRFTHSEENYYNRHGFVIAINEVASEYVRMNLLSEGNSFRQAKKGTHSRAVGVFALQQGLRTRCFVRAACSQCGRVESSVGV